MKKVFINNKLNEEVFCPYRTDLLSSFFMKIANKNSIKIGLIYFLMSYILMYIVGIITGQYGGRNGLNPMYTQVVDNINLGIIAPLGAALLCNLYNTIENTFLSIKNEDLIKPKDFIKYNKFLVDLDRWYNNKIVVIVAFGISLFFNILNYITKVDSWLSINGGITGILGRVFIVFNFYMITLIIYKIIVTVVALQKILGWDIRIQPMHPDNAGGLKAFGQLSVAINSFISIIVIYITMLLVFDPFARTKEIYIITFLLIYFTIPFLLILPLSKANRKMHDKKKEVIDRLGMTFDYYYKKLSQGNKTDVYKIESADELIKINDLYAIVEKMPVWPYDTKSIKRFITTITIPLVVFLLNQFVSTDSILFRWIYSLLKM